MSLIIDNIDVVTKDNKKILDNFSLHMEAGTIHAIMGPNGVGKSTLSKVIMGSSDYSVISGDIIFKDKSILNLDVDERSKMGIFLAMQSPISIDGVTNSEFLKTAISSKTGENVSIYKFVKLMEAGMEELKMDPDMMHRSINKDFSGGERKKNEILQMKILRPDFVILDEIDSGLDVDSLKVVADNINQYLKENPKTSVLIITHYTHILNYIRPNFVHIIKDGKIVKTGDYTLAKEIEKNGFLCVNDVSETTTNE